VLIMSNGGFDNIHERLLQALRSRAGGGPSAGAPPTAPPGAAPPVTPSPREPA
jgi:hypothetical protein